MAENGQGSVALKMVADQDIEEARMPMVTTKEDPEPVLTFNGPDINNKEGQGTGFLFDEKYFATSKLDFRVKEIELSCKWTDQVSASIIWD